MSGDNIAAIIKSPAFTIMIATVCLIAVMNQLPVLMTTIKTIKETD